MFWLLVVKLERVQRRTTKVIKRLYTYFAEILSNSNLFSLITENVEG